MVLHLIMKKNHYYVAWGNLKIYIDHGFEIDYINTAYFGPDMMPDQMKKLLLKLIIRDNKFNKNHEWESLIQRFKSSMKNSDGSVVKKCMCVNYIVQIELLDNHRTLRAHTNKVPRIQNSHYESEGNDNTVYGLSSDQVDDSDDDYQDAEEIES